MVDVNKLFGDDLIQVLFTVLVIKILPQVYSNFSGPQFTKFVKKSDFIRNASFLILLWFTVSFSISYVEEEDNYTKLIITGIVFVFLLIFARQTLWFNVSELCLLIIIYILDTVSDNTNVSQRDQENLKTSMWVLYGFLLAILFTGYYNYYIKQVKDKGENFRITKFIFGKPETKEEEELEMEAIEIGRLLRSLKMNSKKQKLKKQ